MLRLTLASFRSGGAILCFHGVTTSGRPATGGAHVTFEAFKSFVHVARRLGTFVPLSDLVQRHASGRSTGGLVAITFDDAYQALGSEPVRNFISREAIPVTVFVVTRAAETADAYWWDRVEDLFPAVDAGRWRAFESQCGVPDEYRRGQPAGHGPLRPLRQWILANYSGRWPGQLEPALFALECEAGRSTSHRPMTWDELERLTTIRSVELGVHTVSHPVLPLLPGTEMRQEIAGCYDRLRERFDRVVPILAIPFGLYDERTIRISRAAGMTAALTLGETTLNPTGDHALPRFCMMDRDTPASVAMRLLGVREIVRRRLHAQPAFPALPSATT
jgi:peptidoglycan/xylan/chitin deacetylase (PgdA/CDA1 family)